MERQTTSTTAPTGPHPTQMVPVPQEKGDGVAKASTSDLSVRPKAVGRVTLGQSICMSCAGSWLSCEQLALTSPRYRHQLNHNSKQTYHCNFPNCTRTFVRGDLLKRHMDRHAAKGSQLNQRDSMAGHIAPVLAPGSNSPEFNRNSMDYSNPRSSHMQYQAQQDPSGGPYSPLTTPQGMFTNGGLSNGMDTYGAQNQGFDNRPPQLSQPHSPSVSQRQSMPTNATSFGVMSPIANQQGFPKSQNNMPQSSSFVSQQNVMPMNLPPSQFSNGQTQTSHETGQPYGATTAAEYSEPGTTQAGELMMLDQMSIPGTVPVFGGDGDLNKSPYVGMPEDFMAYLFNSPGPSNMTPVLPPGYSKLVFALISFTSPFG